MTSESTQDENGPSKNLPLYSARPKIACGLFDFGVSGGFCGTFVLPHVVVAKNDLQLVGYDSSLMGSLNVMPSYSNYFTLTTTTKSLNTAISYVGGAAVAPLAGFLADWRGRRECVFWSALLTLIGGVIQGAAQNIGMFITGRCIVGGGMALAQTVAPTLVAETTPVKYRGFALGMYYSCWGVGTLIAAGICFGVSQTPPISHMGN